MGPSLYDMIPSNQNYVSEVIHPQAAGCFQYPTIPTSSFAQAMSQITCNPTMANQEL